MILIQKARWAAEAVLAHAIYGFFALLPVDAGSGLAGFLARTIGPRLAVSGVARANLAQAMPHLPPAEIETIVADVWENIGRVAAEFPHVGWLARNRVEVMGIEHIWALRDDGKPGIFMAAHCANWELAGAVVCREGLPITLIYRSANNPWVESIYLQGRADAAHGGLIPKGQQGARQAVEVLRKGGHLGMLVDQKMNDGIPVPFFGRDAMTAPALARFALKYRCPVVSTQVVRLKGAHFRMTFAPVDVPAPTGDTVADSQAIMTRINALIEGWVRDYPGQWLWLHRRWPKD
jgi:KDO2-lipid IV(A) lauroyltransferase